MRLEAIVSMAGRTPRSQLRAAALWLLERQRVDGMWVDFRLAPGRSDEWVTGYVGAHLASVAGAGLGLDTQVSEALRSAWGSLEARQRARGDGAWGYNSLVPSDADSTAWALACAAAAGASGTDAVQRGVRQLRRFTGPGGVSTYRADSPIRAFLGADGARDFAGWTQPHVCVTAAAARHGPLRELLLPAVHAAQEDDGHWRSYWWASRAYATALASTVADADGRARAGAWAAAELALRGSISTADPAPGFELACLVSVLIDSPHHGHGGHEAREAVTRLLREQLPEGNWLGGATLRVPDPGESHPERVQSWQRGARVEGAEIIDDLGVFTTATAVGALARWVRRG